jgi:tRNA modification GTPase
LLELGLQTLCASGARLAQPGEFTLRAFLAGRLDLTQAEAVLGVIDAESQKELDVALRQLAGGLSGPLGVLRDQLLGTLAHLEAGLDFVEEDIAFIDAEDLARQLTTARVAIQELLDQLQTRGATTGEFRVVLRGWPNVGKSSLLNAMAGRQVAIVSPQHGTTRDYVTQPIMIDGMPCVLIDTAGFETTADEGISLAAQQAALQQVGDAHIELFCLDATRTLNDWERAQLSSSPARQRLVVVTKCDASSLPFDVPQALKVMRTSSLTHAGVAELMHVIGRRLRERVGGSGQAIAATAVRCRQSLLSAQDSLVRAQAVVAEGGGDELIAAEMHLALDHLGRVVGAVYTDDILDRIFSQFCIGK